MGGVAGIFYLSQSRKAEKDALKKMCDTLSHRGPDGEGYYCQDNIGLGFRFFKIADNQTCQQPAFTQGQDICAVYDGELYELAGLKQDLAQKSHVLKTDSEAEIIAHSYQEWGEEFLHRLRGSFAIILLDKNKKRLFLARDRMGEKPLYYYSDNEKILVASEIKAILAHPGVGKELDPQAIVDYFSIGYIPHEKSIFKKIRKLKPGHFAFISPGNIDISEYWDIKFDPVIEDIEKAKAGLMRELEQSVRVRLADNIPVGAFLSGGMDSSAVTAVVSKNLKKPLITSSIGFGISPYNELPYAKKIAELFGCQYNEHIVEPKAVEVLEKLIWHYDEPFGDSSMIPTYYVAEMARQKTKVVFSGDGGDENFAGYRRYRVELEIDRLRRAIPFFIRGTLVKSMAWAYPKADWLPQIFRGKTTLKNLSRNFEESNFNSVNALHNDMDKVFFNKDFMRACSGYSTYSVFEECYAKTRHLDPLSRMQYTDLKTYLIDDGVVKVDRAASAAGLGVRCPILDYKFIEYMAKVSSDLKLHDKEGKYVFKKAFEGILPNDIIYRKKHGFEMPVKEWLKNQMKDFAQKAIFEEKSLENYIDIKNFKNMWDNHQKGISDHSRNIFNVLIFALWKNKFL